MAPRNDATVANDAPSVSASPRRARQRASLARHPPARRAEGVARAVSGALADGRPERDRDD
eukprot:6615031-Prymnesium_polylepis.1